MSKVFMNISSTKSWQKLRYKSIDDTCNLRHYYVSPQKLLVGVYSGKPGNNLRFKVGGGLVKIPS
jgi:hypothetical protein